MRLSTLLCGVSGLAWLKRIIVGAAIVVITTQWVNTRGSILLVNQNPARPMVLATYMYFHSMATGLREGRIGQVDLAAIRHYQSLGNLAAVYERLPRDAQHEWVNFYTLDVGYSFVVEAARLAFPSLPDNHLRALMLQVVADAALVLFVLFVFSHWNLWLGLLAAYLYSSNGPFYDLMSFAYYYYWDIPLTFFVLGSVILVHHRPAEATRWLTLAGLALGFGVWLRGTWWPLSVFLFVAAAMSPVLRKQLLVPVIAFAIVATPQVVRSSLARGHVALTTRAAWHVALVGLGYYPNPYGLAANDGVIFKLTKDKYGVEFNSQDYWAHDQAAKKEFLSIWRQDRDFVLRSFFGRLKESIAGSTQTSVQSFLSVANGTYRIACLLGLVAMILRGAEKRSLGVAAAGTYAIYVVLTCVFYFVGLAYDNVPEATLLILFMGGVEAALHGAERVVGRMRPSLRRTLAREADASPTGA